MEILKGMGMLGMTLIVFSVFSFKAPKGQKAMSGLAGAAVATFLVEAIHKYISGDFLGMAFLGEVGSVSGSMGGVAAAMIVSMYLGASPIYAVTAGVACGGTGILSGFLAGYIVGLVGPKLEKHLPSGLDIIVGVLVIAPFGRFIATASASYIDTTLGMIGNTISIAAQQSPVVMGFLLGGIIKMLCTSPLSSMALTAMLGLDGLAMGIASIACVGGSFTNGTVFKRLNLGDKSNLIGVMLEPLTQADVVTANALPIYMSNFIGGGLAGVVASSLGIINNAPGTASPIPGLLAPFAFNDPVVVFQAIIMSIVAGLGGGLLGTQIYLWGRKVASGMKVKSRTNGNRMAV